MRVSAVIALTTGLLVTQESWARPHDAFCLSDSDADVIGNNFAQLISNYSKAFATEVLADDYTDYTDSVITLMDNAGTAPLTVSAPVAKSDIRSCF